MLICTLVRVLVLVYRPLLPVRILCLQGKDCR